MDDKDYFESNLTDSECITESNREKENEGKERYFLINDNYGEVIKGSLVYVDLQGNVRQLQKRFSSINFHPVEEVYSLATNNNYIYAIVRNYQKIYLKVLNSKFEEVSNVFISGISSNYGMYSTKAYTFILNNYKLLILKDEFIFRSVNIPIINEAPKLITSFGENVYVLSVLSEAFSGFSPGNSILASVNLNGDINKIIKISGILIEFKGITNDGSNIYISGNYKGQLTFNDKSIGPFFKEKSSFIISVSQDLQIIWHRFIVSKSIESEMIGDILFLNGYLYTTFRFQKDIAISYQNDDEIQLCRKECDCGFMLIRLNNNEILWRFFLLYPDNINNYISLQRKGENIILSGYSSCPMKNIPGIKENYFVLLMRSDLFEISQLFFANDEASLVLRDIKRVISFGDSIILSSAFRISLMTYPFGLIGNLESGFYFVKINMEYPKLIGVVKNVRNERVREASVVFQGEVAVNGLIPGLEYYISDSGLLTQKENHRYFGTALSKDLLYIK